MTSQQNISKPTALLIVDIQDYYFPGGMSPLVEPEKAAEKAAELLNYFRKNELLVVMVQHAFKKDASINKLVTPVDGEKIITKNEINSYLHTDLLAYLQENGIQRVVICGMMTNMCVEAAARASADFGFELIVIDDACATKDFVFNKEKVKAKDVHLSTLASIDGYYGKVMTVSEFLSEKN